MTFVSISGTVVIYHPNVVSFFYVFPQEPARDTVGGGLLVLTAVMLLVGEGQKVYLLGLVRNPFFPSLGTSPSVADSGGGGSSCLHIYSQLLLIGVYFSTHLSSCIIQDLSYYCMVVIVYFSVYLTDFIYMYLVVTCKA